MNKCLSFGSLNIDRVYQLASVVKEGETVSAKSLNFFAGGKGLNQSVALSRGGLEVWHAGGIGEDGQLLQETLEEAGVHTELLEHRACSNGHAVIQVDDWGRNCIIIHPGSNHGNTEDYIRHALENFGEGDLLVLQNEIDQNARIMELAKEKGLKIALNPSPMDEAVLALPLELVDYFLLNEHEAGALLGRSANLDKLTPEQGEALVLSLHERYPQAEIVLTLGSAGSVVYTKDAPVHKQPIFPVEVKDTTAAGDTLAGFYLSARTKGESPVHAIRLATMAASIAVSRQGAAPSIPTLAEALEALAKKG